MAELSSSVTVYTHNGAFLLPLKSVPKQNCYVLQIVFCLYSKVDTSLFAAAAALQL